MDHTGLKVMRNKQVCQDMETNPSTARLTKVNWTILAFKSNMFSIRTPLQESYV